MICVSHILCGGVTAYIMLMLGTFLHDTAAESIRKSKVLATRAKDYGNAIAFALLRPKKTYNIVKQYSIVRLKRWLTKHFEFGGLELKNGKYYLTYYDRHVKYISVFSRNRGIKVIPTKVILTSNDSDDGTEENVTEEYQMYLGPNKNFNTIVTTPKLLFSSVSKLTITYNDGTTKTFNADDVLV